MIKSEVTIAKRRRLLAQWCCPIHASSLLPVKCVEFKSLAHFCQEKDCRIFAFKEQKRDDLTLPAEFAALLELSIPDPPFLGLSHRKKGPSSRPSKLWLKTSGRCFYCGDHLTVDQVTADHIIPRTARGSNRIENLVPACVSCNCAKGPRSIEEFRFTLQMKEFAARTGISFSFAQYCFLKSNGHEIGLLGHVFWFETLGMQWLSKSTISNTHGGSNDH